jgi:diguanylate cyclase (GGDEF)-like protein
MATATDTDPLTGLPGKSRFMRDLPSAMQQMRKKAAGLAVAIADIDLLGQVNREQGDAAGDRLIQAVAAALSAGLEKKHGIYRFGGDAFAVLMPEVEKEQAFLELETVRGTFQRPPGLGASKPALSSTISLGIAAYPDDAEKPEALVSKACEALYRAKVSGRNKVCLSREEKMVTKTSHYTQGQLLGLRRLAEREGFGEAVLLREALNNLLRKYNA